MDAARTMFAVYAALAIVGALFPLAAFAPWAIAHGFDVPMFTADLFANRVAAFFGLDVIVSVVVLTVFILVQGSRDRVALGWLAIVATFTIGVSCGLPLFLALRERSRRAAG
jgi:hypothetical protein